MATPPPQSFDCRAEDGRCPSLVISGEGLSQTVGHTLAPFRGESDPSLRQDPRTGTLWLSYSWVSTRLTPTTGTSPPAVDISVSIHVARSDDGGRHFHYVGSLWGAQPMSYEGRSGASGHEVSTLTPTSEGWAALDLDYFNPTGHGNDFAPDSFHFEFMQGPDPTRLVIEKTERLGGPLTASAWRPFTDLSQLAGVGRGCPVWTEPSLIDLKDVLYLLAQCKTPNDPARGFLGLFARQGAAWRWIGPLTRPSDAGRFGADELTQADLARARDGSLLLIVTPDRISGPRRAPRERHLGCVIIPIASLDPPQLQRDAGGAPLVRARITSTDSGPAGPGACAYDPASLTGVLIVRRTANAEKGMSFSIHTTGVRP